MANEIPGINMIVTQDGTAITAQSSATLTATPEVAEAVVKATNFPEQFSGDQEWSLSYEGQIETSAGKHALTNGNAALKVGSPSDITGVDTGTSTFTLDEDRSSDWSSGDTVRVLDSTGNDKEYEVDTISGTDVTVVGSISDSTADGAMFKPQAVPGLQSFTLGLEQELNDTPPGVDEEVGFKEFTPLRRRWTVEADGHYYDPANEAIYETIHTARDNGNNLAAELEIMDGAFVGYIASDGMDLAAGTDDNATYSLSWVGSGAVEKFTSFESTIGSLIDLYVNQNTATMVLEHRTNGSAVSGSTKWTGDAHISTLEMELARNEFPMISGEFQGDGALNRNTAS